MTPDFDDTRKKIDAAYGAANVRQCPECKADLTLQFLRGSKRYIWRHQAASDCKFNYLGSAIKFESISAAQVSRIYFEQQTV